MRSLFQVVNAASLLIAIVAGSSGADDTHEFDMIAPADAVGRAERFVAHNGYTREEPDLNYFVPELFDDFDPIEDVLRRRRDTLKPTAYGYMYGSGAILVFFQYSEDQSDDPQYVRVVRMRPDGSDTTLVHQGFVFLASPMNQPDRCEVPPWFAESGLLYPRPIGLTEPLQPTRSVGPNGQREPARRGPRG
jgi:hypothetical protein